MNIEFTPRISGAFVEHVIRNKNVDVIIDELDLTEKEAHSFVKSVLIAGFTEFKIDINEVLNKAKQAA